MRISILSVGVIALALMGQQVAGAFSRVEMICLVNKERTMRGLKPVGFHP
jgi:hypothetical protein